MIYFAQNVQTKAIKIGYSKDPKKRRAGLQSASEVELVLILPPELTSGEKCWVCCHARVLRVEPGPGTEFGVAAQIQRMDVLPEIPS